MSKNYMHFAFLFHFLCTTIVVIFFNFSHEFSELKQKPGFNLAQSMLSFTNKKIIILTRFTVVDIVVNITYSLLHGTRFAATSGEPGSVTKKEPIFSHRLILVTKIHFTSISFHMKWM